jgi:hypothetical protein
MRIDHLTQRPADSPWEPSPHRGHRRSGAWFARGIVLTLLLFTSGGPGSPPPFRLGKRLRNSATRGPIKSTQTAGHSQSENSRQIACFASLIMLDLRLR